MAGEPAGDITLPRERQDRIIESGLLRPARHGSSRLTQALLQPGHVPVAEPEVAAVVANVRDDPSMVGAAISPYVAAVAAG